MEGSFPHSPEAETQETYFFAYSATLRIYGNIPDMEAISSVLGIQPTHTHRKRDSGRGDSQYQHDMWSYTPSLDQSQPLHKHIDALWVALKPHKEYLLQLKQLVMVDVFLGYRSDCETAGIEVPHTSLEMFSELEVPFGLSIIVASLA